MVAYVRKEDAPLMAPPASVVGTWAAIRERFFPTLFSSAVGIIIAAPGGVCGVEPHRLGADPCSVGGAGPRAVQPARCRSLLPFAAAKFHQWIYGFYDIDQRWRVNIVFAMGAILLAALLIPRYRAKG